MQKFKILRQPFLEEQWGRRKEKEKEKEEKKSMIIVVPSCLKDADGARTRSDQKSRGHSIQLATKQDLEQREPSTF